jgi:hypothetical protein
MLALNAANKTFSYSSILPENGEKSHILAIGRLALRRIQGQRNLLSKKLLLITLNSSKITLRIYTFVLFLPFQYAYAQKMYIMHRA